MWGTSLSERQGTLTEGWGILTEGQGTLGRKKIEVGNLGGGGLNGEMEYYRSTYHVMML